MRDFRFSDIEGLRIASEMERRGHAFYRRAAQISKNPETTQLLILLAEDEHIHQQEFIRLEERLLSERGDHESLGYDEDSSLYLSAVAAEVVFPDGLVGLAKDHGLESPAAILEYAARSEKDSILFYSEMAFQARNAEARRMFDEIVRQEKTHLSKLLRMFPDLSKE